MQRGAGVDLLGRPPVVDNLETAVSRELAVISAPAGRGSRPYRRMGSEYTGASQGSDSLMTTTIPHASDTHRVAAVEIVRQGLEKGTVSAARLAARRGRTTLHRPPWSPEGHPAPSESLGMTVVIGGEPERRLASASGAIRKVLIVSTAPRSR